MKIIFTDFETTGLNPDWHEIIEIGAVLFDSKTFKILKTLDIKVKPIYPQRIDSKAQEVNGYNPEEWAQGMGLYDALTAYSKLTKGAVFCAQNVIFDWEFLQVAAKHTHIDFEFDKLRLDLKSMIYLAVPGSSNSLKGACLRLGIKPEPKVHRALNGAMSGYKVFKKLYA